jgi:hypothetical protein
MKTPFVWLFLAWGVHLILVRRTKLGATVLAVGAATVILAAICARRGTYSETFVVSADKIEMSLHSSISLFYWPVLVGVLCLIALRPRLSTVNWRDSLALMFAFGGALYMANLLPWGSLDVYYGSPVIWMLSAAAVRLISTAELRGWSGGFRFVAPAALVVAVLATGYLVHKIAIAQLHRNQAVVNMRDFALGLPDNRPVVAINGPEAAERLQQIVQFHRPDWGGSVIYVDAAEATVHPDYYIKILDEGNVNSRLAVNPVHVWPGATVFAP